MIAPAIEQTIVGGHNIVTGTGDVRIVYQLPAAEADDRRGLLLLLERVRQFWVLGVLDKSELGAILLRLDTAPVGAAISHPWAHVTEFPSEGTEPVHHEQPIGDLFDRSGRALLILGVEGSGKTTTLLQLAQGLVSRAENDPTQPIPIVLNLASWQAHTKAALPWLVAELQSKYYVPERIARSWVERQRLAILLDGLDEVAETCRRECVIALNRFLRDVGAAGVAVCSRLAEYMAQPERLALGGAVRLEPLTAAQVGSYISAGGARLEGLRAAIAADAVISELATSPLLLSVMSLTYQGERSPVALGDGEASRQERRHRIFESYTQRMFARRAGERAAYANLDTLRWLGGLARDMLSHGQRVLLVEGLQPDLLQSAAERFVYVLISRAVIGMGLGAMEGAYLYALARSGSLVWQCVFLGLIFGVAVALVDWTRLSRTGGEQHPGFTEPVWRTATVTGCYWALFASLHGLIGIGLWRAPFGLIWALLFALRGRRQSASADVQPVSGLAWSWRHAARGGIWGLLVGLAVGTVAAAVSFHATGALGAPLEGYLYLSLYAVLGTAFGGVIRAVGNSPVPGRGIRLTIRAAIRGCLLTATVSCALFTALVVAGVLVYWIFDADKAEVLSRVLTALGLSATTIVVLLAAAVAGLVGGTVVGLYFGFLGWLWYGGADVIQHVALRWLLWRRDRIPWRLPRFLDYCTRLIFLQRVGGGYGFVHSALMEYFALIHPAQHAAHSAFPISQPTAGSR